MEVPPSQGPPREPPIPPPAPEEQCPHCGGRFLLGATHCPHCGHKMARGSEPAGVLTMIVLGIGALLFGGFGTCSLLFSVPSLLTPSSFNELGGLAWMLLALGAGASWIAIMCVRRIVQSIRERRSRP